VVHRDIKPKALTAATRLRPSSTLFYAPSTVANALSSQIRLAEADAEFRRARR
jgi:hypothetical protein